jgi:hypothetical protein
MKKLIIILLTTLLYSCINVVEDKGIVVEVHKNVNSNYTYITDNGDYFLSNNLIYQVGDTIKFKK